MSTIQQWSQSLRRFLRGIFVLFLITVGAVTLFSWTQQWWTLPAYGTALVWAGEVLVCLALLVPVGSFSVRSGVINPRYQMERGIPAVNKLEQMQQDQQDNQSFFGFTLLLGLTGLLVVVVGYGVTAWPWFG